MKIEMKCFSDLARDYDCDYGAAKTLELDDGATVGSAIASAGIPGNSVKISFVNGRVAPADLGLANGDRVTLVPPTGGM